MGKERSVRRCSEPGPRQCAEMRERIRGHFPSCREHLSSSGWRRVSSRCPFDVALCQKGLQQFPDRLAALRDMRRVLVRGGWLALSVWGRIKGSPGFAALAEALERHVALAHA